MIQKLRTINWVGATFLILAPLAAIALTIHHLRTEGFVWEVWALAGLFYFLTVLSITGGYHRYFAHRSYECRTWLKWFWALFGAASFQNSIWVWARDHRVHHRHVDTEKDPYSINNGFWFAHMGWMLFVPEVPIAVGPYGRDLERDPVVTIQHKYYVPIAIAMGFGLPTLLGWALGSWFGGLAVAGFLRICAVHHVTFLINSWAHYWGKQTYTDTNTARDSHLLALATCGEGYHNFHHYFANDYRNGVRWYHWDPTKWLIQTLQFVGGAYNLRRTPWSEIIKAQMAMDEKRLKSKINSQWHNQFQAQLDSLKLKVESAQLRFEHLREEYRNSANEYAQSKMDRVLELKFQLRMARIEFRAALKQWRAYNSFLMQTCTVRV